MSMLAMRRRCGDCWRSSAAAAFVRLSHSTFIKTHHCGRHAAFSSSSTTPPPLATAAATSSTTSDRVQINISPNGIAHVRLNRPDKRNALDLPMFDAIASTAAVLQHERSLRAVILSGNGKAFCTGLDVKSIAKTTTTSNPWNATRRLLKRPSPYNNSSSSSSSNTATKESTTTTTTAATSIVQKVMQEENPGDDGDDDATISAIEWKQAFGNLAQDVGYLWRDLPVPVIAVLHGMCWGGGLQIALGADFRFATPDCQLSIMEAKWGLIPDMSASVTLRELVRIDVAKELTMTGRILSGTEAASLGLITRCVEDPWTEAQRLVEDEILKQSPDSVAAAKRLYQTTWVAPEAKCLEVETSLQRQLLASWNQLAASARNFGWKLPYRNRKEWRPEE